MTPRRLGEPVVGRPHGHAAARLASGASRLLGNQLYGVEPQDPLTLSLALGVLVVTSLVAAYVPALRASRLNPIAALRQG